MLGEVVESETQTAQRIRESGLAVEDDDALVTRYLFKVGNRELGSRDFVWHIDSTLGEWTYPEDAGGGGAGLFWRPSLGPGRWGSVPTGWGGWGRRSGPGSKPDGGCGRGR